MVVEPRIVTRETASTVRRWSRPLVIAALACAPAVASASDYSSLIFSLLEVPMLIVTCIAVAFCFSAPRGGLWFAALVLLVNLVALGWGAGSGYTDVGGYLLVVSAMLQAFGILVATKRLEQQRKRSSD